MRRVIVHIDSLVLKGFRAEDRHAIAQGLQEQLTRVLATPGIAGQLQQVESVSQVRAGNINIAVDTKPRQVGTAIANKLGKGFGL